MMRRLCAVAAVVGMSGCCTAIVLAERASSSSSKQDDDAVLLDTLMLDVGIIATIVCTVGSCAQGSANH